MFNLFGKKTQEQEARQVADATSGHGSGAEQDRYGAHFNAGGEAVNRVKDSVNSFTDKTQEQQGRRFASATSGHGSGAEQDRYESHFNAGGEAVTRIKDAAVDSFDSLTNKTQQQAGRRVVNATSGHGSGAEQDRWGSHFGGAGEEAANAANRVLHMKGSGAEQDRYQRHFGVDHDRVQAAVQSLLQSKSSGTKQNNFGLGYDGQQRVLAMANTQGVGAEQDRFGSHFGVDKDSVKNAAQSVQDSVQQAAGRK